MSILKAELDWYPPKTSPDKLYLEFSKWKTHVEILESKELIKSDIVRKGLYGLLSQSQHAIREHPVEEIYMAMVRVSYWKFGYDNYKM